MASALLRRSAVTAALAAVATIAAPLAGTAFAADPAPTTPTFTPANSATVKANQPPISAAYATPLDTGASTLTVTDTSAGNAGVACPVSFTNNNETMTCTPTSSLVDGHVYKVTTHAANGAGAHDDSASWTVDIPSLTSITPADGSVVGDGATTVKAVYDEAIAPFSTSFITITDPRTGNTVKGGSLSASSPLPNAAKDTISFTPPTLPNGTYFVHVHVESPGNAAAFSDDFINYTVNTGDPTLAPTVAVAGYTPDGGATHWINGNNKAAVPFSGTAQPDFRVGVIIFDDSTIGKSLPVNCTTGTCQFDRMATVGVADCGQSMCPWSLTVNTNVGNSSTTSATPDKAYKYWVFAFGHTGNRVDDGTRPPITKDTVAPIPPNNSSASAVANALTVTAQPSDNATFAYKIVTTDAAGQTDVEDNVAPLANGNLSKTFDVSKLEDGESSAGASSAGSSVAPALNIDTFAYDQAGNLSSADPTGPATADKEGNALTPDFANSFVTVNGTNIPWDSFNNRIVNTPTSITLRFNELIRSNAATSSGHADLYDTGLRVEDAQGFPVSGTAAITGDKRQLTWTFASTPTDAASANPYVIRNASVVAGSCPDGGATTANCEEWPMNSTGSPTSGVLASFTIDNTAPTVTVSSINGVAPGSAVSVDASNIKSTVISGTVDNDATAITLSLTPAGGSTVVVPSDSVNIVRSGSGAATWQTTALDLSRSVGDGAMTITSTAVDGAGNRTTSPTATTTVQARPSAPQGLAQTSGNGHVNLTWLAPATNGGAAISGYTLTITDTSVAGSAPQTVALPASPTAFTATNLTNGHTYSLALTASNGAFNGPAATVSATPKGNTTLTSIASRGTMTFSQFLTVHGTLSYLGTPLPNEPVTVTTIYFNRTHGATYHVSTDQNGNWIVAGLSPPKNVTYVASFAGDSTYNPSSGAAGVRVRALVRVLHARAKTSSHLSRVTLSGRVRPSEAGRRIYIYELRAHGRLHRLGSVRLTRHSTWFFTRLFARGRHTVVARIFSHNGNLGNFSNRFHFRRT